MWGWPSMGGAALSLANVGNPELIQDSAVVSLSISSSIKRAARSAWNDRRVTEESEPPRMKIVTEDSEPPRMPFPMLNQ